MLARGAEITAEINGNELIITVEESDTMEIRFGYTDDQCNQLVKSISEFTGQPPVYQNAPTFVFFVTPSSALPLARLWKPFLPMIFLLSLPCHADYSDDDWGRIHIDSPQ